MTGQRSAVDPTIELTDRLNDVRARVADLERLGGIDRVPSFPLEATLDGTSAVPAWSFVSDPNTGMFRIADNRLGFTTGGGLKFEVGSTIVASAPITATTIKLDGSPDVGADTDEDCPIVVGSGTGLNIAVDNNEVMFRSNGAQLLTLFGTAITHGTPGGYSINNVGTIDAHGDIDLNGNDLVAVGTISHSGLTITGGNIDVGGAVLTNVNEIHADVGSATDPSYTFDSDTDTGIYSASANRIDFTAGGVRKASIASDHNWSAQVHRFTDGSATLPGLSFGNDIDTGFFRHGSGQLAAAVNGKYGWYLDVNRFKLYGPNTSTPCILELGSGSDGGNDTGPSIDFYGGTAPANYFAGVRSSTLYFNSPNTIDLDIAGVTKAAWTSTGVFFQEAYDATTAGDAYVKVSTTGRLRRHTSTETLKRDIEPVDPKLRRQVLSDLRLIWGRSTSPGDDPRHGWFMSSAESAAEVAPWLAQFEYPRDCGCQPIDVIVERDEWVEPITHGPMDNPIVDQNGYWRTTQHTEQRTDHTCGQGRPIGFDYPGLTVLTADAVNEHQHLIGHVRDRVAHEILQRRTTERRINDIEQRLAALEPQPQP